MTHWALKVPLLVSIVVWAESVVVVGGLTVSLGKSLLMSPAVPLAHRMIHHSPLTFPIIPFLLSVFPLDGCRRSGLAGGEVLGLVVDGR